MIGYNSTMNIPHTAATGLWLGLVGVAVLSPDALILRLFEGNTAALVAGRAFALSVFAAILVALFPILRRGFQWRPGLLYATCYGVGLASFPVSVLHTHVANTVVILAVAPLLAAIGAKWFLGETVAKRTWLAATICAAGLFAVFAPQLTAGGGLGDALALVTAFSLAAGAITIRRYSNVNLFPGFILAGLGVAVVYAPFADFNISAGDYALLAGNGTLTMTAFLFIMAASRRLSPPEVNLLFLLETLLAPLWVWMALGEQPPLITVAAGVLIAATIGWHSAAALRATK